MATVGTRERPAIVRVQTEERAQSLFEFCQENGIAVMVSVEPDKAEDIADIERAVLARQPPPAQAQAQAVKVGRNDPCPCGSGKKFKKCCIDRPPRPT